jgi:4-hydroxythreonine-4-phosphate dehydrogenase
MGSSPTLAFTLGDPRGIGPEVIVSAIHRLRATYPQSGVRVILPPDNRPTLPADVEVHVLAPAGSRQNLGQMAWDDLTAGRFSVDALDLAIAWGMAGEVQGIVTGPVSKPALHAAGALFPGQTELLQDRTGAQRVGMLMAAEPSGPNQPPLRILLMTTHMALRQVPTALTQTLIRDQLTLLNEALIEGWGIPKPTLALCALNPHASDGGLFGDEEATLFAPVVSQLQAKGIAVEGPFPADTVFRRALDGRADAVAVPYHDVGMAVFKSLAFGAGVNVTLGLPFVRTSPDHGTAFDLAGQGVADPSSAWAATELAYRLAEARP